MLLESIAKILDRQIVYGVSQASTIMAEAIMIQKHRVLHSPLIVLKEHKLITDFQVTLHLCLLLYFDWGEPERAQH